MRCALLCLPVLLCACASAPAQIGEAAPKLKDAEAERNYHQVVAAHTRDQEVYRLFDTRMFVNVTYESWPFREARTRRVAAFQLWPDDVLAQKLTAEKAEFETETEFFMGVHMNDMAHDDFDKKDSIWRIALVTDAGETRPTKIERIGRSTLDMRALYPYMYDFWIGYRVTFPKVALTGKPTLKIASTVGHAELTFPAQ